MAKSAEKAKSAEIVKTDETEEVRFLETSKFGSFLEK